MGFVPESQLRSDQRSLQRSEQAQAGADNCSLCLFTTEAGRTAKSSATLMYKLFSREAAGQREINDPRVQQSIRQGLRDRKAQLLQNAYYEMLHDEAKVRNYFAEQILKKGAQ